MTNTYKLHNRNGAKFFLAINSIWNCFSAFWQISYRQPKLFYVEKFGFQQNKTNDNEKLEISKSVKQKAAFKKTNNQCQSVIHCKCLQGWLRGFSAICKYCRVFPANIAEKPLNHPGNICSTSEEERAINQFYYFQCQGVQTVLHYIKAKTSNFLLLDYLTTKFRPSIMR